MLGLVDTEKWLGAPPSIPAEAIAETIDTELLVVGAGMTGLTAMATAAELGVKTLLIEVNKKCTPIRKEIGAIGSRLQKKEHNEIDIHEIVKQMVMYGSSYVDQRLLYLWARESGEAIDWYTDIVEAKGATMTLQGGYEMEVKNAHYTKFPTGHKVIWPTGVTGADILCEYGRERGAEIRMQTALIKLVQEGERVTGAIIKDMVSGKYMQVNASKGVIVATGGYAKNDAMMEALQPDSLAMIALNKGEGATYGDGIKACLWVGAAMDVKHVSMLFDRCAIMPDETPETRRGDGENTELLGQPFLKVDLEGRRFSNESQPYDFASHRACMLPGKTYCVIFDSGYREDTERFDMAGCSRMFPFKNGAPCGHGIDENEAHLKKMVESGRFVQADTIAELAEGLGIPADNLEATVARYNELFDQQRDDDFGKEPHRLSQIRRPPFYGARTCASNFGTLDGIRIDENMNAVREDGSPIEGLYVCGDDSGGFFSMTYVNLSTGCCAGRNMTFARRAAKIIAGTIEPSK